jgi:hypothetical protein
MSERLSPDRRSFKQFLFALFRQIQRQGLRGSADDRIDPECLPDLIQIRQEVRAGKFDLNAVINRLTKLTQRIVGASGVGVWLFTSDEVFLYAGAGSASNDESLRLEVISKLARACQLSHDSASRATNRTPIGTGYDLSDPHDTNSLLVEPVHQGQNVAGALAALSDECTAFTQRDVANLHLLADLLGQALSKAAEAGLQESVILEPAAILQLIDRIIPALERMLENDENARHSTHGFLHSDPGHEFPSAGIPTKPFQDSQVTGQEAGATQLMGGAQTGGHKEPHALWDSPSSAPLQEISVPRIEAWAAWKSKLAKTSTLWPVACQKWERTAAPVRNCASRILNWATVGLPAVVVQRGLRYSQASFLHAIKVANTRLQTLLKSRSSLRAALRAAPVAAILVIIVTFLILKARFHSPAQTTASGSRTTAREKTIPLSASTSDAREAPVAEPGAPAPLQVSHMHATDLATEDALRTLSHYEFAGLRRRAEYGDDSAAFQMGMAYEIGRGLPQSCTTAAQWVARAAGEGNAAAQYNLGLRYHDGDGVAVDDDEAVKWLQKAAAQQNFDAQVALGVLTAHQARVIPSSQTSH